MDIEQLVWAVGSSSFAKVWYELKSNGVLEDRTEPPPAPSKPQEGDPKALHTPAAASVALNSKPEA